MVLTGARQTGRTSTLRRWFPRHAFVSLDLPTEAERAADTGLLCALLNIGSADALRQSPAAGAVWETFVFAQLRHRERRAGRVGSLFFWRDRAREVDFVAEAEGRLELFETKWTELPSAIDAVNLEFVRNVVGKARVTGGAVVCRAPNTFPLAARLRAAPVTALA
ncbi:MAG TPA: DUF4143 domain-containing protein [Candidatus Margulisiibacteriota bacterium]|nr:DUF4143 domain-containing protein [Candidatus Margulisiibacteriota bacterium]